MADFIQKIISNFWYASAALIALTGILHLLLVYPSNLSKKAWKRMDYLWLLLTMTGLLSATNTVNTGYSEGELQDALYRGTVNLKAMRKDLSPIRENWVCRTMVKDEYSPANFDEIVADFERACAWRTKLFEQIIIIDTANIRRIDTNKMPYLQARTETIIDYRKEQLHEIEEYNKLVAQKEEAENRIASSSNRSLTFLTPLLLILGFALRLTKITGELKHEK